MIGIVVSRADAASVHIGEHLREIESWAVHEDDGRLDADGGGTVYRTDGFELREFDSIHLELEGVADAFSEVDLVVFASRHAGETGRLLTAHHPGNFGPAEYGGSDNALARACPNAHAAVLDALADHAPDGYDVGMECTHHGPTGVGAPAMFVEVGSAEPQWNDPAAAEAVARAILDLRGVVPDRTPENGTDRTRRHLVGFGGNHYAPRFERIVRETDWAVGHIGADWGLDAIGDPDANQDVIERAFERSQAAAAVLDGDRPNLEAVIEALGYDVVSETWVRETEGVPLQLVRAVESDVGSVDSGLRFGARAQACDGDEAFTVRQFPADLLGEAQGIDPEATREAVAATTLAYQTEQHGTRVASPIVLPAGGSLDPVVEVLAEILDDKYETVTRTDDAVVVEAVAFDPERARERGVPEGPAFGKLSAGEPVEVDGETVTPTDVHERRRHRFELSDLE